MITWATDSVLVGTAVDGRVIRQRRTAWQYECGTCGGPIEKVDDDNPLSAKHSEWKCSCNAKEREFELTAEGWDEPQWKYERRFRNKLFDAKLGYGLYKRR